jgi:hypothetical protein
MAREAASSVTGMSYCSPRGRTDQRPKPTTHHFVVTYLVREQQDLEEMVEIVRPERTIVEEPEDIEQGVLLFLVDRQPHLQTRHDTR